MKVLIACEESQAVCVAFRERGHEAYSCDILPCSGGHPEWHIQDDVLAHLNDGWDMMIAFPPCTHLAVSGARHFEEKRKDGRQQQGIDLFMAMIKCTECGKDISDKAKNCPYCGKVFLEEVPVVKVIICSECETVLSESDKV